VRSLRPDKTAAAERGRGLMGAARPRSPRRAALAGGLELEYQAKVCSSRLCITCDGGASVNAMALFTPARAETFTNLRGALDEVAGRYQIHVGLKYALQDKDLQPINLDLSEKSVETVLNQLVRQKTDYVWAFADNVYYIFPKSNSDNILDVQILEFEIKALSSKEALSAVGEIPEIKHWLLSHSVSRRELYVCAGACGEHSEKLVTLSLKGTTFRTLLNMLVREFGTSDWMVCRYGDKQEYIRFTSSGAREFSPMFKPPAVFVLIAVICAASSAQSTNSSTQSPRSRA
jgi:hypothetical protein